MTRGAHGEKARATAQLEAAARASARRACPPELSRKGRSARGARPSGSCGGSKSFTALEEADKRTER